MRPNISFYNAPSNRRIQSTEVTSKDRMKLDKLQPHLHNKLIHIREFLRPYNEHLSGDLEYDSLVKFLVYDISFYLYDLLSWLNAKCLNKMFGNGELLFLTGTLARRLNSRREQITFLDLTAFWRIDMRSLRTEAFSSISMEQFRQFLHFAKIFAWSTINSLDFSQYPCSCRGPYQVSTISWAVARR